MNEQQLLLTLSASLFVFGLLARRIEHIGISAPMLVTAVGIISGPRVTGWLPADIENTWLQVLAEFGLAIILFTDASQIRRDQLVKFEVLPIRLLAIGLPLTMVAGALLAKPLLGLSWLSAAWLAIMLAPTDAALAQAIFSDKKIPERLRHSITVESGLNDGLALPILLFVLALMQAGHYAFIDAFHWPLFLMQQFVMGTLAGLLVGRWGGRLIQLASDHHWMLPIYQRLSSLALALLAYSGAEVLGGNGFIAAFLAGLFLEAQRDIVIQRLREFGEAEGTLLSLLVFFLFGLVFVAEAWPLLQWQHLVYALLSLTVIRIVPVLISLLGSGLNLRAQLFLAWFGPRGIASVLYLLLAVEQMGYASRIPEYNSVFATTVLTVLLSIFLHGVSPHLWPAIADQPQSRSPN
ncbi:cation:proton antiporter [Parathalassolituus penaei]|uniref:Cation:proton antiporter n=1 Tax=Parathalassolituus penaei TaxID=2997323 RepID=A0A9X3IQ67_9GAMM|nr:cation:proton antiporter [Parathalassolituus penaei]MCY0963847.1 cation:proton antiporter [Parathalassolituus penaei]